MVLSSQMVLYNVTMIIDDGIHDEWLSWINEKFIPAVHETGLFTSNRLLKVLDSPNEGVTYCLQFTAGDAGRYQQFKDQHEPALLGGLHNAFANRFVSFSTLMEVIG